MEPVHHWHVRVHKHKSVRLQASAFSRFRERLLKQFSGFLAIKSFVYVEDVVVL